jgi:hypothetical protein
MLDSLANSSVASSTCLTLPGAFPKSQEMPQRNFVGAEYGTSSGVTNVLLPKGKCTSAVGGS